MQAPILNLVINKIISYTELEKMSLQDVRDILAIYNMSTDTNLVLDMASAEKYAKMNKRKK